MNIRGLLMRYEVRQLVKEVPLYVHLSLQLKALPAAFPLPWACLSPPPPPTAAHTLPSGLHLTPLLHSPSSLTYIWSLFIPLGLTLKCGISVPWALPSKCQAPKYPLKCRQMNRSHQCLCRVPAGTLAACMTFQRSILKK